MNELNTLKNAAENKINKLMEEDNEKYQNKIEERLNAVRDDFEPLADNIPDRVKKAIDTSVKTGRESALKALAAPTNAVKHLVECTFKVEESIANVLELDTLNLDVPDNVPEILNGNPIVDELPNNNAVVDETPNNNNPGVDDTINNRPVVEEPIVEVVTRENLQARPSMRGSKMIDDDVEFEFISTTPAPSINQLEIEEKKAEQDKEVDDVFKTPLFGFKASIEVVFSFQKRQ
eukprot:TRINITY_DN12955_c0_g2_i1.p1 TRINITY_DN12955_c0_g2~~TRINITY_DN12955_c0_g2_i1.p1  ORF type:complete len:250 (-),score=60.35 TRINITY_DN12955_c0_g2_i1:224-925(-)